MKTARDDGLIRARPPKSAFPVLAFARTSGLLAMLGLERVFPTVNAAVDGGARGV